MAKKKKKPAVNNRAEKIEELYDDVILPNSEDAPAEEAVEGEEKTEEETVTEEAGPVEEETVTEEAAEEETESVEEEPEPEKTAEPDEFAKPEEFAEPEDSVEPEAKVQAIGEEENTEPEEPEEATESDREPETEHLEETATEEPETEQYEEAVSEETVAEAEPEPEEEAAEEEPEAEEQTAEPETEEEPVEEEPAAEEPLDEEELPEEAYEEVLEAEEEAVEETEYIPEDEEQYEEEYIAEEYGEYDYAEEPEEPIPLPPPVKKKHAPVFTRYSILVIPEGSKKVKSFKITVLPFVIALILLITAAVVGIFGLKYFYDQIMDLRNQVIALNANIVNITNANVLLEADKEELETQLREANAKISTATYLQEQTKTAMEMDYIPSGLPLDGHVSTPSAYTDEHKYITFTTGAGAKIIATGSGKVKSIIDDNNLGHVLQIDHGNGYVSVYYSPSDPLVKEGDSVIRGTPLFLVQGDTETLTYQILYNNNYIDPNTIMNIAG